MCRNGCHHGVHGHPRRRWVGRLGPRLQEGRKEGELDVRIRRPGSPDPACNLHGPHHLLQQGLAAEGSFRRRIRPRRLDCTLQLAPHQRQQPHRPVLGQHWPRVGSLPHWPRPDLPILVVVGHLAPGPFHRVDPRPDRLQGPQRWLLDPVSAPAAVELRWRIL